MREIRRVAPSGGGWDLTGKGGKGELWVMKTICIFLWVVVKQLYTIVTTFWTEYLKYEHFILCNKVDLTQQTKKKKKMTWVFVYIHLDLDRNKNCINRCESKITDYQNRRLAARALPSGSSLPAKLSCYLLPTPTPPFFFFPALQGM